MADSLETEVAWLRDENRELQKRVEWLEAEVESLQRKVYLIAGLCEDGGGHDYPAMQEGVVSSCRKCGYR